MLAILEELYRDVLVDIGIVVIVVEAAVVADKAVGLTTPKQILSIPITSKTRDKSTTVDETEEPGINKITAASRTEIDPNTIWSTLNQAGVCVICITFILLVPQHQELLYKYHSTCLVKTTTSLVKIPHCILKVYFST